MPTNLTAAEAHHFFNYNPETGELTWNNPIAAAMKPGDVAGSVQKGGTRYVYVNNEPVVASRLVWLMSYGEWPPSRVLTRNKNAADLRLNNLYLQVAKTPPTRTAAFHRRKAFVKSVWNRMIRDHITTGWKSFDQFSAQVGEELFKHCILVRRTDAKPIGPSNYKVEARSKFDRSTKEGRKAYQKYKNSMNLDVRKSYEMRTRFGITLDEFRAKVVAQKGVCAICGEPETASRNGQVMHLSVDHCHTTGDVRDLLCKGCNNGIGWFKENPAAMRAAADYIERHKAKQNSVPASNVIQLKAKGALGS